MNEDDFGERFDHLEQRVAVNEKTLKVLKEDMTEIRGSLRLSATKDDILKVKDHMTLLVTGVLRDALNNVPLRQAMVWTAVVAVATTVLVVASLHVFG